MSIMSPKKLAKKHQRAKEVRKKILARRDAIRAPKIEENKQRKKAKRINKLIKDMGELNVWADEVLMRMDNSTLTQLEKNAQILRSLEAEYESEKAKKEKLNEELHSKGLFTLQEKLNHLSQELISQQREAGLEIGEVLNEKPKSDKPPREVSEVTVLRAADLEPKVETTEAEDLKENIS